MQFEHVLQWESIRRGDGNAGSSWIGCGWESSQTHVIVSSLALRYHCDFFFCYFFSESKFNAGQCDPWTSWISISVRNRSTAVQLEQQAWALRHGHQIITQFSKTEKKKPNLLFFFFTFPKSCGICGKQRFNSPNNMWNFAASAPWYSCCWWLTLSHLSLIAACCDLLSLKSYCRLQ